MVELRFEALSTETLHDFLDFFDHVAFNGSNEQWTGCYCQFYLNTPERIKEIQASPDTRPALNRESACSRIETGQMQGYLAYDKDELVGWVAAGESKLYPGIPDAQDKLARILCFVIHPKRRNEGIATSLLQHVVGDLRVRGFEAVESAPYTSVQKFEGNYRGTVSMFEKAGFELVTDMGEAGLLMRLHL